MNDLELENGLKMSYENAESLLEEANLLFSKKHYCRAYTLFQLASEEFGKCKLIAHSLIEFYSNRSFDSSIFKNYGLTSHIKKTKIITSLILNLSTLYQKETGKISEVFKNVLDDFTNTNELNDKKNQSLYVCLKNDKFVSPKTMIDKKECISIKEKVELYHEAIKIFIRPKEDFESWTLVLNSGNKNLVIDRPKVRKSQ